MDTKKRQRFPLSFFSVHFLISDLPGWDKGLVISYFLMLSSKELMSSAFVVQEVLQVLTVCFTYYDIDPTQCFQMDLA